MMQEFPGEGEMPYDEFPEEGGSSTPKIIGGILAAIAIVAGIIVFKKVICVSGDLPIHFSDSVQKAHLEVHPRDVCNLATSKFLYCK